MLEEAHRFAPHNGEAKSKSILKTILSEGRKFGIGVCLVSQRPSKLAAGFAFAVHDPDNDADNQSDRPAADSPEHREREQGVDL